MLRFHNDCDTRRLQTIHERFSNLSGEIFLNLQTPRKNIDNARDFGEADDFSVWDVSHVTPADERQQVVFAQRIKLDVFDEDNLARL